MKTPKIKRGFIKVFNDARNTQEGFCMDNIGPLPEIHSMEQALQEIIKITRDTRSHVLLEDTYNWERLKQKAIAQIAQRGLKLKSTKNHSKRKIR